jgi:hypothetical protein
MILQASDGNQLVICQNFEGISDLRQPDPGLVGDIEVLNEAGRVPRQGVACLQDKQLGSVNHCPSEHGTKGDPTT